MIIVMKESATVAELGHVIKTLEDRGFQPRPNHGAQRTVIGIMEAKGDDLVGLDDLPGVDQVAPVSSKFKMVSRDFQAEPTVVQVGDLSIGAEEFVVMAGPCGVETVDQLMSTARAVKKGGGRVLRGGAYKPRTSPYSFQGLREEGLKILSQARAETGLPIITEIISPELVPLVARYTDIMQIGARNMQNYALLEAVGSERKPVLLKRGLMSTIEEMLLAAEYLMSGGNSQVMLCERGIRTFEPATRNTLDLSAVSVIKQVSHLPVIVDPSHAVGHVAYVADMCRASVAAGADGIIIETHPDPARALSDGQQSLTFDDFQKLMDSMRPIAAAMNRPMYEVPEE
ncbi:MAG: 3-deoxy-7-phosphoheptulonate synthase [Candidatus Krumholzibacteriia bacterium]|jgi:3-deoxy-7-phosphoheptulonate synthase